MGDNKYYRNKFPKVTNSFTSAFTELIGIHNQTVSLL